MKRQDWLKCVKLARSSDFEPISYLELRAFDGCALDNKRRTVTMREVASLIVGHCATFGGTWLHTEEEPLEALSKRFDLVG
jgi:hypothetical protein